ncbi:MAG: AtpZ/AtpI family protein [Elusimicrobium sp.]|jgi:F0F1-type ATP synthase assembly protein I|nr:AtpZ/AtpI family protein [Elusimicrobium sp.]
MNKRDLLVSTQLGLQFALTVCLAGLAGYWADKKLGTLPLFTIILAIAGFVAAMYYVIKEASKKGKKND